MLTSVRRGDPLAAIRLDQPKLTQGQIKLVQHLQTQELDLHRLYRKLQNVEHAKMLVERDLLMSLLRTNQPC